MEAQKREIAVSVAIFFLMVAIGIMISSKIANKTADYNAELHKAMHIENIKDFHYNKLIGAGSAFAYFEMKAISPQSLPEIKGQYLYIEKNIEKYTMHTRLVPVFNSKGEISYYTTEIYYTWDWAGSTLYIGNEVQFNEVSMSPNRFGNWPEYKLRMKEHITDEACRAYYNWDYFHIYKNSDVRYYYTVVPLEFTGAVHVTLLGDDIAEKRISLHTKMTPNGLYEAKLQSTTVNIAIFWLLWLVLTGGLIFGFIYLENKWLKE